jgi:hypothetical protein
VCSSCLLLVACGGSSPSNRQQIVNLFNGMYAAFAQGNWSQVCGDMSTHQQGNIVAGARRAGLNVSSCAGAFTTMIKDAGVSRAQIARAFGASGITRKLESVSIHGNQATLTFSETEKGQTAVETDALVRQGGQWRADRILKRSGAG